jgi:signal transduction histidine kinase
MGDRRLVDVESSLWRAAAAYRLIVLGYAAVVLALRWRGYERPWAGWLLLAALTGWTLVCLRAYPPRPGRGWPVLVADLGASAAAVIATLAVDTAEHVRSGAPTIPTFWASGCVVAWAIQLGVRGGLGAAAVISLANEAVRPGAASLANIFLLFLAGVVVGYVADLARAAEAQRIQAAGLAAATAERERLARDIHDGVLQILALVQRRGTELGGEAADLGALAGEQERLLRALVSGRAPSAGPADLGESLRAALAPRPYATLALPAGPVLLEPAAELVAAVAAALDNVRQHAGDGARAYVLVEDEPDAVTVTIRDDGGGIPAGRLDAARTEGRLGVAQSIVGRMRALGGTATLSSTPEGGTEVELRLPRVTAVARR